MLVREGVRTDEDRLTHSVFGLMRYLPSELWFRPFIQALRRQNPMALGILDTSSRPKIELWPSYLIPEEWKHAFWRPRPKKGDLEVLKGSICPDALIITDDWIMFVESEYSHDLDTEQLFQQFAIANNVRKDRKFFVLLNNPALTRPSHCNVDSSNLKKSEANIKPSDSLESYISACCSHSLGIKFTLGDVKQRLLWINWQSLNDLFIQLIFDDNPIFTKLPESFQRMVELMRNDVCELLEREGLNPINFDILGTLVDLCVNPDLVPSLPTITPISKFLSQLHIDFEVIPQWHRIPDILKTLKTLIICPESIAEAFLIKKS